MLLARTQLSAAVDSDEFIRLQIPQVPVVVPISSEIHRCAGSRYYERQLLGH
jgi:hypothetical protein